MAKLESSRDDRRELEADIRQWVVEAESEHDAMVPEWNEADRYYESDQVPPGFTDQHAQTYANVNDPTRPLPPEKEYVVLNKHLMSHETVFGEFVGVKRELKVSGRTPSDRKIAKVIRTELDYIQDSIQLWDEVVAPCMDKAIRRGLHWLKAYFDPTQNLPYGKVVVEDISCRDVLVDPDSRRGFYQDTRYRIHRKRMLTRDANIRFRDYLDGRTLAPDQDTDSSYDSRSQRTTEMYSTIYEVHYQKFDTHYYVMNGPENPQAVTEISDQDFQAASNNQETANKVFAQDQIAYYVAWFNTSVGVFYNEQSEYNRWALIPMINISSESRPYPFGSAKYEKNLQDFLNVLVSVMLKHAKRAANGIYTVDPATWLQYKDQIDSALNSYGRTVIPANNFNVHYPRDLSPAMVSLFQIAEKALADVQSSHELTQGEMPRERLAKETVSLLLAQDRKSHGRKELMLRWTLTETAKFLYEILRTKYSEQHWTRLLDTNSGADQFIPVNAVLTEGEYYQMLLQLSGIQIEGGEGPEVMAQKQQMAEQTRRQFEKTNSVQIHYVQVYVMRGADGQEQRVPEEQILPLIEQSGLTQAEFYQEHKVKPERAAIYIVNYLDPDTDMDIVYTIDFNYERDRQVKMNRSLILFDRGAITAERLLQDLEYPDAEEAASEAKQQNQIQQIGEMVTKNPELYQMVMNALQGGGQGGKKNGKPEKKEKVAK